MKQWGEEIRHRNPEARTNWKNLIFAQLTPLHFPHPQPPEAKGMASPASGVSPGAKRHIHYPPSVLGLGLLWEGKHQQRRSRVSKIKERIKKEISNLTKKEWEKNAEIAVCVMLVDRHGHLWMAPSAAHFENFTTTHCDIICGCTHTSTTLFKT